MVRRIAHIGIATPSLDQAVEVYRRLGLEVEAVEVREPDRVRVAVLGVGDSAIELLEPLDETSPVHRFLAGRGPGIHHVALEVDNLESALDGLAAQGVELVDRHSREGAGGRRIAFIHPRSVGGVLVELCDRGPAGHSEPSPPEPRWDPPENGEGSR
ncbi:MAG: methylmalonyl-CoA epimerase [Acidobacteriota bacterium]